ncbi:hypothetical protein BROUX41_004512 [Berkeleyomyces rouxiae]|uniref:uncharacterized protein n=1 Tax=Berkeleyomyces rouxiae TaxID=2035830 RepID=UPI003B7BF88E
MAQPSDAELTAILASPFPKAALRDYYAEAARHVIAAGTHLPFLVPTTFLGGLIIPPLFLAFSQRGRPWLRSLRWAVMALILALNADLFLHSASTNVACGYGIGMVAVWSSLVAAMALVFLDAQDLERVAKRPRSRARATSTEKARGSDGAPGELLAAADEQYGEAEYYWQSYPHDGTFGQRFLWGFDIVTSIRGSGWTWAISTMPQPPPPSKPHTMELIDMSAMPVVSRSGHVRCRNKAEFCKRTLLSVVPGYLLLDFLTILVEMDPFFMAGPRGMYPPFEYPPPHLSWVPSVLLPAYRQLFFLICILAALNVVFHHLDVVQFLVFSYLFPMRAEPWMYCSIFGPVSSIWETGLTGLWGIFWHQTFRAPFMAPVRYIWGHGRGRFPGKKAALFVSAFLGSGLMHSGASFTSMPVTDYIRPLLFFLAQAGGIGVQKILSKALRPLGLPKWLRRMGNVLFVLVWLYGSAPLLGDDFAAGGVWMLEPSPYSVLRAMGYGYPGDTPWRWDRGHMGSFYVGKNWWAIGYGT